MPNDDKFLVKYVRNADGNSATERLTFDDDRKDLLIGKVGYVTQAEVSRVAAYGIILESITEAEAEEQGLELPEPEVVEPPLRELSLDDLKDIAKDEGVEVAGLRSKDDFASAIESKRAGGQDEGRSSLPATAGTGPSGTTPTPSSASTTSGTA